MPRYSKRPPETVTIGELHQMLEDLINAGHAHRPIYYSYNYGDYSRTQAINSIANIEELPIEETGYSQSGWCIDNEGAEFGAEPEQPVVYVIREV